MSFLPTRRLLLLSAGLALLVVLLAACAAEVAPAPTAVPTQAPPSPTPLPRGGSLTVRLAGDVPDLRPWQPRSRGEEQIVALLYSGLTRLDPQLRPVPDLAERWDASADGRTITFTLRPDVSWHDGQPFTSADVVFTIGALRAISPTNALLADIRRITRVTAPTTMTAVIELDERHAPIVSTLSVPMLPRHLLDGRNLASFNAWDAPVGTGPFQLAERKPGASIVLAANKAFYRGWPLLDRVAFVVAPDAKVAAGALRDGRLLLAELPWLDARVADQQIPGLQVGLYPENAYYFLAFNLREGRPFADLRVRRALASAVNLPALVKKVTDEGGIVIGNSALPGSWADQVRPPTATVDLERAADLLDDAGWRVPDGGGVRQKNGVPLATQIFVRGDDQRRVRAAELIAAAGNTVGMSLTVQPADFETVIKSKYVPPYDFDLLLGSWMNNAGDPAYPGYTAYDPDDFALFHSSQLNQGISDRRPLLNLTGFADSAYDNQAGAARQLYDLEQRAQAVRLAQQRIAGQLPYLFLWADQIPVLASPQLTTLDGPPNLNTPMYMWNIERWYLRR